MHNTCGASKLRPMADSVDTKVQWPHKDLLN